MPKKKKREQKKDEQGRLLRADGELDRRPDIARAVGMFGGRPEIWNSPDDLLQAVNEVFEECKRRKVPFTITRLAAELRVHRDTLYDYAKNKGDKRFSDILRIARLHSEASMEEGMLTSGKPIGYIFALKNHFGWRDDRHVHNTHDVNINTILTQIQQDDDAIDGELLENE